MTDANLPAPVPSGGQVLIYRDGSLNLQVRLDGQTAWLTQAAMAELFQTSVPNINIHVRNVLEEGELEQESTIKDYLIVQIEGRRPVRRSVVHYNLDMILAVGYRVRSPRGTQFRQWATAQLRELLVKGFVLDDQRIKAGRTIGQDYFEELLARIRDIRASERLFYQKEEIGALNRIVSMYLDYAEDQARRKRPMHMTDWIAKLDDFLRFNERNILTHAGKVSHELAEEHAHAEFLKHDEQRRALEARQPTSDFDKLVDDTKRAQAKLPPPKPGKPRRRKKTDE